MKNIKISTLIISLCICNIINANSIHIPLIIQSLKTDDSTKTNPWEEDNRIPTIIFYATQNDGHFSIYTDKHQESVTISIIDKKGNIFYNTITSLSIHESFDFIIQVPKGEYLIEIETELAYHYGCFTIK